MIVLDTNIVLDLFVFDDPAVLPLKDALQTQQLQWIATAAMREELARVLAYKQIVPRLAYYQRSAAEVLATFDRLARLVDVAPKAHPTCKDPDDQKFIDLAVAHKTPLLSKDHAVLCMKKRLLALDVPAQKATDFVANLIPEPTA
ncbi:MAG: putative toxin-antitoxin system toxin component, PIN family [Curvibacter sp. GWA2_64_110]|nr:MAG: putative toxin-antitoxin system toxin component, PIN family [Curvibacter sp. GWA2_64_110]HCY15210.1 putative toxin-antitoxin system toxin component, PIN family [Curvibacter sp.]